MTTALDTIGKRIRARRKLKGFKQAQLAKILRTDPTTISRWENDEQGLTLDNAQALAHALGTSVRYLNEGIEEDVFPLGAGSPTKAYPIVGELQAGVWRETTETQDEDYEYVQFTPRPETSGLVMSAYVVRGNSMNLLFPAGSYVLVASTIANNIQPRSGQSVLVSRKRKDGLYEATLKEFEITPDGKQWLKPRSTSPEHQTPIQLKDDATEEVTITGIVTSCQVNFPIY